MTRTLRKLDYIISFVILMLFLLFNIVDSGKSIIPEILLSVVLALLLSLVIGTITNFLFRKKST